MLALLLLACSGGPTDDTGDASTDDTGDAVVPPSVPGVAAAVRLPHGALSPECVVRIELATSQDPGTVVSSAEIVALGGEWLWIEVDPAQTWVLTGTDTDCIETSDGTPFVSSTFAVAEGQVATWWWLSTQEGLELLDEGVDFERGVAVVELDPGAPPEPFVDFVENLGGVAEPTDAAETYSVRFAEDRPVAAMLAELSRFDRYVDGGPVWIADPPGWW